MLRATGCDGVVVGRGCLGRPWLFRDLADVFAGREPEPPPRLGEVARVMLEHAELLAHWCGEEPGLRSFRKHAAWYTKGFRDSARLRQRLTRVATLAELRAGLADLDPGEPFPAHARACPAASTAHPVVALPDGYPRTRRRHAAGRKRIPPRAIGAPPIPPLSRGLRNPRRHTEKVYSV
jgi:hypothetical protein